MRQQNGRHTLRDGFGPFKEASTPEVCAIVSLLIDRGFVNCIPGGGQRRRFNCPVCYVGGKSEPKSMVVIESGRGDCIVLYCHRASCPSRALSKTGGGIRLATYLRHFRPDVFDEYSLALRAEARGIAPVLRAVVLAPPASSERHSAADPETLLAFIQSELPSAFSLAANHPARLYVERRRLPERHRDLLLWDDAFNHTAALLDGQERRPGARLVIPYLDFTGKRLTAILGRSIQPDAQPKYLAAKTDPDSSLIFGLDRIDPDWRVLILEGPLDSLFMDNAAAVTGTALTKAADHLPKEQLVLVFDNQAKIADHMIRAALDGFRVAVWWLQGGEGRKDINDLVLAGYDPEKLAALLIENSFTGTEAVRRIWRWRDL